MAIDVDVSAPLRSLKAQGVVCNVTHLSEPTTLTVGGWCVPIECARGHRFDFMLPKRATAAFVLAPERTRHRFFKLFSDELQTHDAPFDAAVFITTDHETTVAAWLNDPDLRALILIIVGAGGQVVAQAHRFIVVVAHEEGQSEEDAALAAAALAASYINFDTGPTP